MIESLRGGAADVAIFGEYGVVLCAAHRFVDCFSCCLTAHFAMTRGKGEVEIMEFFLWRTFILSLKYELFAVL